MRLLLMWLMDYLTLLFSKFKNKARQRKQEVGKGVNIEVEKIGLFDNNLNPKWKETLPSNSVRAKRRRMRKGKLKLSKQKRGK